MSPVNEALTEEIVRKHLREKGYYDNEYIIIEEKSSKNQKINDLLKTASKRQTDRKGYPEFIISFKNRPTDIMVIECKADITKHESKDRQSPIEYAVDGALWYAKFLKESYNVTAIGISGENEKEVRIDTFLWVKNNHTYKSIQGQLFLKPNEIESIITKQSAPLTEEELVKKAIEYNCFLNRYSIPERERCTLISSILVGLQDETFLISYKTYVHDTDNDEYNPNENLIEGLLTACKTILNKRLLIKNIDKKGKEKEIPDADRIDVVMQVYADAKKHTQFISRMIYNKDTKKEELNTILRDFIDLIRENIFPYLRNNQFDLLGKFYTQFIRYAGSEAKKGLVLTPSHITDFSVILLN